jgi:hypothetical protein
MPARTLVKSCLSRVAIVVVTATSGLAAGALVAAPAFAAPLSFDVNTTGNAGDTFLDGICDTSGAAGQQCTLRGAIQEANANAGADTITFSLLTPFRVTLNATGLPPITSPVTIDGTTLPGFSPSGGTIVRVDGVSNTTGLSYGLDVQPGGAGTKIKGLEIDRFSLAGVRLASSSNTVSGNYIGTTAASTVNCAAGVSCSTNVGVSIEDGSNNTVGGTATADRNVLSNNASYGVQVTTISGSASGNTIAGNYVGTNVSGSAALPNGYGFVVTNSFGPSDPTGTTIGGTAAGAGNVISGNSNNGIDLAIGSTTVAGNIVGLNPTGATAVPNSGTAGVYLSGAASAVIGGVSAASRNIISGNGQEGIESTFTTGTITVQNNYIGTDITGTVRRGNQFAGVYLSSITGAVIDSNVISGNSVCCGGNQMQVDSTEGAQITNNLIGFRPDGSTLITGADTGLSMNSTVDTTVSGNTIGGNTSYGIYAGSTDNLVITNNKVGTDIGGTLARGNGTGIQVDSSSQAVIGASGAGNLVSANTTYGIVLSSTVDSSVKANRVGTDVTGANALNNGLTTVWLNNSSRIDVGGTSAGDGNVIGGVPPACCEAGIYLSSADDNRILGNRVGVNAVGGPLANNWVGIYVDSGSDVNQIGDGTSAGANLIANNADAGIAVAGGRGNRVRANSISANGLLGIDLNQDGVTANDTGDPDTGSNRLQNFPILATSASNAGGTQVTGSLNSRPNRSYVLDFFSNGSCDTSGNGEGQVYLGSKTVSTDGSGNVSYSANLAGSAPAASSVTATATDVALGDTSEFSSCLANQGGLPAASVANVSASESAGNLVFTVTLSSPPVFSPVTVDYATADGTATAGSDYTTTTGTVTFTGVQTTQTVSVPLTSDTTDEVDETLTLTLSNPSNALIGAGQGTATGTILDDDAAPTVNVANAANVNETNAGTVNQTFNVTLSAASSLPVSVIIATLPGTATAQVDYDTKAQQLTFAPGETAKTFQVVIFGDVLDENDEKYFAKLFSPSNATLGTDTGQAFIIDNDPKPSVSVSDVTAAEGNAGTTNFTFTVSLSAVSGRTVIANVKTTDGTAIAPSDYGARTNAGLGAPLTFAPGVTSVNFVVAVKGNVVVEPNEQFTADIVSVNANATIGDGQGIGTIQNDD